MALIRDIQPPPRQLRRRVGDEIVRLHKATQLTNIPQHPTVKRIRGMDILPPSRPVARPVRQSRPQPKPRPKTEQKTVQSRRSFWRTMLEFAQYPLIAGLALASAYSSGFGQVVLGIYAVAAIVLRWSSRYTFGAALLLLASVPGFQLIKETGVAEKAALYAYELLVVGVVQAVIELIIAQRKENKA